LVCRYVTFQINSLQKFNSWAVVRWRPNSARGRYPVGVLRISPGGRGCDPDQHLL